MKFEDHESLYEAGRECCSRCLSVLLCRIVDGTEDNNGADDFSACRVSPSRQHLTTNPSQTAGDFTTLVSLDLFFVALSPFL